MSIAGPIINLGLPKSGTTTLCKALKRSGIKVADWKIRPAQTQIDALKNRFVGELIYEGYFETTDPLSKLTEFGAVTEMSAVSPGHNFWPQTDFALLTAIQRHHPNVKFLLSARDPAKTAHSMLRWNSLGKRRLPRHNVPGLPRGFGATPEQLTRWIEGHYAFCRHMFAGASNFLEFSVEDADARARLSAFLGRDLPWWGHANTNAAAVDAPEKVE